MSLWIILAFSPRCFFSFLSFQLACVVLHNQSISHKSVKMVKNNAQCDDGIPPPSCACFASVAITVVLICCLGARKDTQ